MLRKLGVFALAGATVLIWQSPAGAQVCSQSQALANFLGYFENCFDGMPGGPAVPLSGFAYAPGTTATTGTSNIVCEFEGEVAQGAGGCFGAGIVGDTFVTIDANWANAGVTGCPNPTFQPGIGRNVIAIRDYNGGAIITSVGYDINLPGYIVDLAFPAETGVGSCLDTTTGRPFSQGVVIRGVSKSGDSSTTNVTVDALAMAPRVLTDCDSTSVGIVAETGTCTEGLDGVRFDRGNLYYVAGDCSGANALDLRRASWTAATTASDGSATITTSFASDLCLYVGSSLVSGTTEGPGITSFATIAGNLAASPRALDVRAKHSGKDVIIEFRTASEVGLIGFEIRTKSGRVVGDLISPTGVGGGGSSYSVARQRGLFKAERELYVVSRTTSGELKSDPATF
jgi:hypothetical protein